MKESFSMVMVFNEKWLGENSPFFLIHIHVLMLCRKFELILINLDFLRIF